MRCSLPALIGNLFLNDPPDFHVAKDIIWDGHWHEERATTNLITNLIGPSHTIWWRHWSGHGQQMIVVWVEVEISEWTYLTWSSEEKEDVLMTRGRSAWLGVDGWGIVLALWKDTSSLLSLLLPALLLKDSLPPNLRWSAFALGCRLSSRSSCLLQDKCTESKNI